MREPTDRELLVDAYVVIRELTMVEPADIAASPEIMELKRRMAEGLLKRLRHRLVEGRA